MGIVGAVLVPHPPLLLPEIGMGRESEIQSTRNAYQKAAQKVAEWSPDLLVVISPHTAVYADYFHISPGQAARGDMSQFGAPQMQLQVTYDDLFVAELVHLAGEAGISAGSLGERDARLDHGTFIPLWFLQNAGVHCPVVRVGLSGFPPSEHYRLGKCIAKTADTLGRRTVVIASGDLSHKLTKDGPYGFAPQGPEFDEQVTKAMKEGNFLHFLTLDPTFCNNAAECGLRSLQIMAGTLDGQAVNVQMLSYEGPFGVGYAVAVVTPIGTDENRHFDLLYEKQEMERLTARRKAEDPWVQLARQSLETYIRTGKRLHIPRGLPEELMEQTAGTFVSLHQFGRLRGCIGTVIPVTESVAQEIIQNAISAGTEDPRFPKVRPEELASLEYSVDVLAPPEPVTSPADLDVKQYGIIVTLGRRRGLLLPNLDGVDTVEQQIAIACQKGGIDPREPYSLERFQVVRHV